MSNWSATKSSMTTVQWKDQTTLVGRPIKSGPPIYFFGRRLFFPSCRGDLLARGTGPFGEMSKFPHTNHKKPSVSSHTLAPTTICDLSHSVCWSPLTDLGHISSVTYVCHPLWFVCGNFDISPMGSLPDIASEKHKNNLV